MTIIIDGSSGITLPAGGTGNTAGALIGATDTQTLTNKTLTGPTITGAVMSGMASSVLTSRTAVATTSGTSIDFTSIPSWVKRVTVMFSSVSLSGTSSILVQIGSSISLIENTGYSSTSTGVTGAGGGTISSTAGYALRLSAASGAFSGHMFLTNLSGNLWISSQSGTYDGSTASNVGGGTKNLSAVLDRIRLTTVNGTDTFDAGSVNIMYE